VVLKAIACYAYQSSDWEDWERSRASAFCETLRFKLIGILPGYDAAPWGIEDGYTFPESKDRLVEVIHSRDPDYECHIGVFVDGFQSDFAEFTVDPGAGDTRADWNESRQLDLEQVSERGPAVPGVGHRLRIRVVLHRG